MHTSGFLNLIFFKSRIFFSPGFLAPQDFFNPSSFGTPFSLEVFCTLGFLTLFFFLTQGFLTPLVFFYPGFVFFNLRFFKSNNFSPQAFSTPQAFLNLLFLKLRFLHPKFFLLPRPFNAPQLSFLHTAPPCPPAVPRAVSATHQSELVTVWSTTVPGGGHSSCSDTRV